ncbi:MAG: cyanophycinase [Gammaproteobacteria bacterium]|nr:cyanophycinase [Gammaproteobacteria bacterium]MDH4256278.1 cyanophycinase [Gammaproteobacteria bacterium]MDH5311658.1 cyanophycinase [Gammaproteobacteria bacterium]
MAARLRLIALSCLLLLLYATSAGTYRYFVTGNPADVSTDTSGLIVLQGGGDDVDANYVRMGELGGGGDFVVLRASGGDDYNDYIFSLCGCDSVETIVFHGREAAFEPFVIDRIRNAEALFLAGGDQSNYVRYWKGTPVEDAIHYVAARPAPIGGTSAGMAILGEFSYSAMTENSLTAANALADPYHPDLTLETDFLELAGLEGLITDQHLVERDRIGRTLALLARLVQDGHSGHALAMAADRETAVHLDPSTGRATIHATPDHETPFVYFLRTSGPPAVCRAGSPLTIADIEVHRLGPGDEFDLRTWTATGGLTYSLGVAAGRMSSSRGEIY